MTKHLPSRRVSSRRAMEGWKVSATHALARRVGSSLLFAACSLRLGLILSLLPCRAFLPSRTDLARLQLLVRSSRLNSPHLNSHVLLHVSTQLNSRVFPHDSTQLTHSIVIWQQGSGGGGQRLNNRVLSACWPIAIVFVSSPHDHTQRRNLSKLLCH